MSSQWPPQPYPGLQGQQGPQFNLPQLGQTTAPQQGPPAFNLPGLGGAQNIPMPAYSVPPAPRIRSKFALDKDTLNKMSGQAGFDTEESQLVHQQKLADKLRADAPGLMKSQSPIYTPNWAGALASVYQNYRAGEMDRDTDKQLKDLAGRRTGSDRAWIEQYFKKRDDDGG